MAEDEIDAHVRRLWRHRGTTVPGPRRGPRGELDLDEILEVAIALADAGGLDAVSTRTVAAHFGKTPMALYAYVGSKEQMLALMQDHASAMPAWPDPVTSFEDDLRAWAFLFFDLHVAHPWLTSRGWDQHTHGPHEQDWMERLLGILGHWAVPEPVPVVTMLYGTVRATAETAAAYRDLSSADAATWRDRAAAISRLIPDFAERYPRSVGLRPVADWAEAPRAGLAAVVRLITRAGSATEGAG